MTILRKISRTSPVEVLLILIIAAATYLPGLSQATIYRDDWYYTMDRLIGGPGVFQDMFKIDRPARGRFLKLIINYLGSTPFLII